MSSSCGGTSRPSCAARDLGAMTSSVSVERRTARAAFAGLLEGAALVFASRGSRLLVGGSVESRKREISQ